MACATPPAQQVVTVSVGYADGWLRSLSNVGIAIVDGIRIPLIGNVSIDSITFDVSALPASRIAPGNLIDLICPEHTVDAVANLAGTIGYEVLTSLGPRYHRQYVDIHDEDHVFADVSTAAANNIAARLSVAA
jgi:alanine racemase